MKKRGFAIIELLVVVTIIAILLAAGLVSYTSVQKRSRDARRKSDIEQVRSALEMYKADNGYYPDVYDGGVSVFTNITALSTTLVDTGYLSSIPQDPKYSIDSYNYPYQIEMQNAINGLYHAYCIAALLEVPTEASLSCTATTVPDGYNHSVRNP